MDVSPWVMSALVVLVAAANPACTGSIDEAPQPPGSGPNLPDSTGAKAADDAARAENPDLFEVALKYFPSNQPQNGRARLFRLTRRQLDGTALTLLPESFSSSALAALPADPLETNYEYADNLDFNAANFTPYTGWVAHMVEAVRQRPATVVDCAATDSACLRTAAEGFVLKAFRGVVSESQMARFIDFFLASVGEVGLADATADLVDVTLTSPSFVFREEVQTDGERLLRPAQRLQNITYTLADAPPEALGLSSVTPETHVATDELAAATVAQVLETAEARNKLLRFFMSWLEIKQPDDFNIAQSVFPQFTVEVAQALVDEMHRFLESQLAGATPSLKDLTASTRGFVSPESAFLYGVVTPPASPMLVELDPAQRIGIFTHPAMLASHSGPTSTRLIHRGVFFTRKAMCLPLGMPPDGVDTSLPETSGATERERVEAVTSQGQCAGCHDYINPFGFALESYDAIGRWRTADENGLPIDPSISVDFLDEGPLATGDSIEALRGFTQSLRFQQCFARQLFRFYTGRKEGSGDDPTLRQMFFHFANAGQHILGMLQVLANSPGFSRRAEVQ